MPDDARCAGLTLIGWLARRMDGEAASTDGVEHARRQVVALVTETRVSQKGCSLPNGAPPMSRAKKHSAA
ncbi:MAG: hypothetical protein U0414_41110 [Polyangiaceae bacterium]